MVIISIVAVVATVAAAPVVAPGGQRCSVCHSGASPASGYRFTMPAIQLDGPAVAPPNWTIDIVLVLEHKGRYDLRAPQANLTVDGAGALSPGENSARQLAPLTAAGGSSVVRWRVLTGASGGLLTASVVVRFTVHFGHTSTHANDDSPYALMRSATVTVRPVALFSGQGEVVVEPPAAGETGFEIIPSSDVHNVTLKLSKSLQGAVGLTPVFLPVLAPGQRQFVRLDFGRSTPVVNNGRVEISWENGTGATDATFIVVRLLEHPVAPAPPGSSTLRLTGRVTGMFSLALLIVSAVLGSVKAGGERRGRAHCAISWFILGLGLYHGLILVWGPYSSIAWNINLVLGYGAAVAMGVSGANGVSQKWMSRKAGIGAWLWIHRVAVIVAVTLVVVHAVLVGTDMAAVRSLLVRIPGASP